MSEKNDLLRQEKDVQELLRSVPIEVVGARLRRARQRMGYSIRDLAEAANVSKNSVVRLESGGLPHPVTLLKLCAAMGIHVASIAKPTAAESQIVAIHRRQDDRWYDLTDFGAGPIADRPLSEGERAELVRDGVKSPLLILSSRLDEGKILPTVIELYRESEKRSHAGEEMVYVLKGSARIDVGPESFILHQGESATFWSAEEHSYAPATEEDLPVRVLSIRIDDKSRTRTER
ncbi:MAG TPA: XRE family transcriptional regulator [Fimbriimonadaceae bacterium]|nr:XRE family transcriptional regulator [Fimbriimonadaceae bacterium]